MQSRLVLQGYAGGVGMSEQIRVRLEGFTYGPLLGHAKMPYPHLPEYGWHILSDCGKVGIVVNAEKVKSRIEQATERNESPVFYYD
jgi:hypothetical protein